MNLGGRPLSQFLRLACNCQSVESATKAESAHVQFRESGLSEAEGSSYQVTTGFIDCHPPPQQQDSLLAQRQVALRFTLSRSFTPRHTCGDILLFSGWQNWGVFFLRSIEESLHEPWTDRQTKRLRAR